MKYVILKAKMPNLGIARVWPIIFPERLTHSQVAENMQRVIGWDQDFIPEVFSAGFCYCDTRGFGCIVGSESLNIKKDLSLHARDEDILNMPEALQGMVPC